ncbi:UPF0450 protein C17orf58 homolog isoform X1 [Phascolarctos cinereus]|uniref:UPF0450 protein C17orf58 homolog isoform X1 n=2 Tax=Phascolarctos cinereus TaxID=38626 RepID=A0A6P5LFK2_PHACI|nr:UPF0450 protein C17orf58 homolog isoform X1 [Phascolarctos cinereus]
MPSERAFWLLCLLIGSSSETPVTERKDSLSYPIEKTWGQGTLGARAPGSWRDKWRKASLRPRMENSTGARKAALELGSPWPPRGAAVPLDNSVNKRRPSGRVTWPMLSYPLAQGPALSGPGPKWVEDQCPPLEENLNSPGRPRPDQEGAPLSNRSKASWLSHQQQSRLRPPHGDTSHMEKTCETGCKWDMDEKEFYCMSEFAVNGIVHDVEVLGEGIRLVTLLVNSHGLYKTNRLYITPDGFFFQVHVLVLDSSSCNKAYADFKFGSRYIVMGHIYHKRRQLSTALLQVLQGRLRPGDGLLRSSSSYVKRFNRKRDEKIQRAAHTKCI